MAGKRRTIDPELFSKAEFRRATYVQREVWIGIIATCCDDEGRFEADAWNLSELIFSRSHDANEEAVTDALAYWCQCGWLLLYEEGRYGFLTGWYEHQYIRDPEPSSLPPPPAQVNSWRVVMGIKEWFMEQRKGGGNTHFRTILREFEQSLRTDSSLSAYLVRTESVVSKGQKGREGKLEGKGKEKDSLSPSLISTQQGDPTPISYPQAQPNGSAQVSSLDGMFWQQWQDVLGWVRKAQPTWELSKSKRFTSYLANSCNDPNTPVTREEVLKWLQPDGELPSMVDTAETWLKRRIAQRGAEQRTRDRASPTTAKYAPATQAAFAAAAAAREAQTAGKGDAA